MNIIDAIKSGKRFRRKSWTSHKNWLTSQKEKHVNEYRFDLPMDAIIADDWEVEQTLVTITREQFDAAWWRAEDVCENMEIKTSNYLYELVVRELGL